MINSSCSGAQTCPPGHLYLTQLQNDPEKIINYAMATIEDAVVCQITLFLTKSRLNKIKLSNRQLMSCLQLQLHIGGNTRNAIKVEGNRVWKK